MSLRGETGWQASHQKAFGKERWKDLLKALRGPVRHTALVNRFQPPEVQAHVKAENNFDEHEDIPLVCICRAGVPDAAVGSEDAADGLLAPAAPAGAPAPAPVADGEALIMPEELMPCYYLDGASVLAAMALGATPGENVLDLCAAPGGKSAVLATMLFAAPPAPAAIAAEPGAAPSGGGPGGFTNVAGSQDDEKAQPASLQLGSRARFVGPEHIGADLDLAWGTEVVLRDERDGLYFVVRGTQNGGGAWIAGIHLSAVGTQAVATPERAELRLLKAIQQGDPATLSAITVGKKYAQNEVHLSSKPQCKPVFNSKDNFLPEFQEKFLRDLQKDFQEIPPDRSCINMVGRGDITQAGNEILDFMRKRKGAEIYKVRPEKYWCSGRDYADGLDFTWKIRMYPREDGAKAETQHRGGDVVGYCNWVKEVRRHFQNAPVSKAKKIVVANDGKWIPDDLLKQIAQERMAKMAASADAMTDDPASKKMQGLQEKGAFG
eukprot:TRINITY_DN8217_c0_g2_i1.p1 TRINITY_DN8217_c0_g2~~TRINITY_DN8217_c0_g2_i1.p1  ORF type:complete len:492 (+),score=112.25 TRINITY_DN8217_c0_g2_i1:61-1536(+)